jgi:hypothetical protein
LSLCVRFPRSRLLPLAAALCLALLTSEPARGQGVTTGAISGVVRSVDGRALEGIQVLVTDERTGTSTRVVSNAAGRYLVSNLQPGGPYALVARRVGYRPVVRTGIVVPLARALPLDVRLESAPVEVPALAVVSDADPIFNRGRTGAETTLSATEIASLPTIGGQITDYAIFSPAVVSVRDGVSAAGQNFRYNNLQVDGALNHDLFGLTDTGIPGGEGNARAISVEAIEGLQILVAPFDVRHSGFTGGMINAVTRSGTHRWQGSVFGHHINDSWISAPDGQPPAEFSDSRFGWTVGGPLVRDKLFLFTSGEFELESTPAPGPAFTPGGPVSDQSRVAGIHPDSARRFIELLEGHGLLDPGTTAEVSLDNPRTNLLARFDLIPGEGKRLVVRHNYSGARSDQSPLRGLSEFRLSSSGRTFNATTNSTVAQFFSRLGEDWDTETILNLQFVRLDRQPLVEFPLVQVDVTSEIDGELFQRRLGAGADEIAQGGNTLHQDIFQLTTNFTRMWGRHQVTIGTQNELFRFRDRFLPLSLGIFQFGSLGDLETNSPELFIANTPLPEIESELVEWGMLSLGGYVQDVWSIGDRLVATLGLRVDIPVFLDEPRANPEFQQAFGFSTAQSPSPRPRIQPRLGFNWTGGEAHRTQLRGGVGLFSGRPSFVWLSNAFRNTGNGHASLICPGPLAPPLDAANSPDSTPQSCTDGAPPSPLLGSVEITDPNYAFPLDLKLSLGVDRQLPRGFSATADVLFTRSIDQPVFEEVNLIGQPVAFDARQGDRPLFGTPTPVGLEPVRINDEFAHVVRLTNGSGARALQLSFGLHRHIAGWLRLRSSYTFSDVDEKQAMFFPLSTFGFAGNPIRGNPNDPELATSPFERRHSFVVSATAGWKLGSGLDVALTPVYFATSGAPYSYTVQGDVNGDGYRSNAPRIGRDNDLIYVPGEPGEVSFRSPSDATAFSAFIDSEPCLRKQKGRLMEPYSCFAPWQQRWDIRGTVGFGTVAKRSRVELVFDVINLFGHEVVQPARVDLGTSILRLAGRVDGDPAAPLMFDYVGPADRSEVLEVHRVGSQRRFQAGARYRF